MTVEQYILRLNEISIDKLQLLQQMVVVTKSQSEVINEDGIDDLDKLISEKQGLIDTINKLDNDFSVYYDRLKTVLKVNSLDEIKGEKLSGIRELQTCVGRIMETMQELDNLQKSNDEKAKIVLDTLQSEIKRINQGKIVNNAYRPATGYASPSYFLDKKK